MAAARRSSLLVERGVTRREAEVLAALAERSTNADIAARLYLSERTVESHVASLLRKLGARNRVELGDLARDVTAQDAAPTTRLPAPLELLVESSSFVGRSEELTHLRTLWDRAVGGSLLVGIVAGEAGMGKSRLVAELAAEVHRGGAQVMWGGCFEDVQTPYQPFVQAISADATALTDAELRRRTAGAGQHLAVIVPELASLTGPTIAQALDPGSVQAQVFNALHGYLVRSADVAPVLLVIEDVHWATGTTLGALRHIARMSGHAPALVLVTTRDQTPDVHAELALVLADLGRLASVGRVDLAGLPERDVAALLDSLGARVDPASVRADTGGNPLLVREVASAIGGTGSLPGLLARRYALLDPHDLAVLDVAAVIGHEFDADLLATAVRYPLPVVLESIERAEAAGIVTRAPGAPGQFSFVHALFRASRYDGIPDNRRAELHHQIVGALRERADDDRVLPELARHASMAASDGDGGETFGSLAGSAGLAERARRSLRDAGDRALALNDFAAASAAYEGALRLWPAADPERPAVLLGLGRAVFSAERRGSEVLAEARDGMLAAGDSAGAAEAEMMLGELEWIASRWDAASVHFDRAAAHVADQPATPQTARVIVDLAKFRLIAGDHQAARAHGARAVEMARTLGSPALEADVLATIGPSRVTDGDLGGIADLETAIALAERIDSPVVGRAYANLSYVRGIMGDLRENHRWRSKAREAAERFGLTDLARWADAHDTEYDFHVGRWDDALAGAEAFIAGAESSAHYLVTVCLRVRARVRLGRGNQIGALADAAAAVEFARGAGHPSNLLVALPFHARCLHECGRAADADASITEALKSAAGNEHLLEPIETAIVLVGLGRESEWSDVAARITFPSLRADVSVLIAGDRLERAADGLDELGYRSAGAYLRLTAARRLSAQGRRGAALGQLRRALAFHRGAGATAYVQQGERLLAAVG